MTGPRNTRRPAGLPPLTLLAWLAAWGLAGGVGDEAATAPAPEIDACAPTQEALLVRGVRAFEQQDMRRGHEILAQVVAARPEWPPARYARSAALLRSGRFREAAEGFAALLGEAAAQALGSGELQAGDLDPDTDPELVFGLAIARHFQGHHRPADRLYRAYADLVGSTSEPAARAYLRLAEMFSEIDVAWGDAASERAKALAVDPLIASKSLLPPFPDFRAITETEPYTRDASLAPDRPSPIGQIQSLPVLIDWTATAHPDTGSPNPEWERGEVEILISEDGRPNELALSEDLDLESPAGASIAEAVTSWCFEPAVGESGSVAAWILFEVDVPVTAAPDSAAQTEAEQLDAAEGLRDTSGAAPPSATPVVPQATKEN